MVKTSTLLYSINNLSTKIHHEIILANDLGGQEEFNDVYGLIQDTEPFNVNQEVVDKIMDFARQPSDDE